MLQQSSEEEICNHLYVTEPYYFDPKKIKRAQILSILKRMKEEYLKRLAAGGKQGGGKKNFLERKGINNDIIKNFQENEYEDDFGSDSHRQQNFQEDPLIRGRQPQQQQQDLRQPVTGALPGQPWGGLPDFKMSAAMTHRETQSNQRPQLTTQTRKQPQLDIDVSDNQQPQTFEGDNDRQEEGVYDRNADKPVRDLRRIQIEGEDEEYQMDEDGNIYDLNGNFIGVANPDEIEELAEYDPEIQDDL
eukprot:CAMPEP_0202965190 /NCGR_PEP_ID=MMETSP1396-20130829/9251_1 /ASSEMBLY_ACC=CAM_ASM_000872 /TAXON_ID= /ORGANISM="Pseudokeronopsis sp., Strain Brazil" /LENGTH=245 /DNA_ID=CAMNT_0049687833 /DNA_START=168 /DNA_END=908 /DNA_ORIENTATION=-